MKINRKIIAIAAIIALAAAGTTTASLNQNALQYKNLKVLPLNISSKDLQEIMTDDFQPALGVSCDFCHATAKDGHSLDFASDAKPEKEISRTMMRMTLDLNKKYFKVKQPLLGSPSLIVTCNTCHKGAAFPEQPGE
ncbi:MAG: c-type cytochrome [Flavipsychrobacter sp.]